MKELFKKEINRKLLSFQKKKVEKHYNHRVKNELLNSNDTIEEKYIKKIASYWEKYGISINTDYHKWYSSRNGIKDTKYISENIFYNEIIPFYNNLELADAFADKAYYNLLFPDVKMPNTLIKNINGFYYDNHFNAVSLETVIELCSNFPKLIVKPTIETGGGRGLKLIEEHKKADMKLKLKEMLDGNGKNFIIQEFVTQHEVINKLNSSSVNTIRVFSFLRKNEVIILGAHIRIGEENSFHDHFGMICGIDKSGDLYNSGLKSHDSKSLNNEDLRFDINNVKIPNFNQIINIIKREHAKLSHFQLVGWDFAIDYTGDPLLIEFNIKGPGINNHQLIDGPLFREYTDEVLKEVFNI